MAQQYLSCHYNESMGFFYNNSGQKDEWDKTQLILVQVVGSLFCFFILAANSLVIAAVITNRKFHFPFYYLLSNLAASDFLAGIAYVYLMFNTGNVSRTLSVTHYFVRQGLLDVSLSASLANLLVIALERYISVLNWKVHSNLTKRRVTLLIFAVWTISIIMGAVPSLGWNCICSLDTCSQLAPLFSRSYLVFWSISNLVVFIVMVVVYTRIFLYVKRKTATLSKHTNSSVNRKKTPIKLIKTVMVVIGAFVICWTPGLVVLLMDGVDCRSCEVMKAKRVLLLLAVANSVMNPCIYSYKDEEMWKTIKSLLCCICTNRRLKRSLQSTTRSLNSGPDTGNSQPSSEETKNDEQELCNK
ncbi:lysophosphatidic acid receptor 3 [Nothobranchius furzeri]|uniref:Lysophosphatidic acid receptor 3 n=2 Tax=Nothobranchius furzeri TaxID=105023 RepID=A0A8C6Q959_NOTFU|nr:lysophosphatidic acid receptor 3 [Nothobranchius furzeri]KAF7202357.1 lysophosphatidic acid receptor 3 [Nothobranchius furzeri]